jgi:hypothetical protein
MTGGTVLAASRLRRHWRTLPIGNLTEVIGVENCLVLAPQWGWTLHDDAPIDELAVGGRRLDVAAQLGTKRSAIAAHASQYGDVIADVPDGFQLPVELLRATDCPWETVVLP